MKMSQEELNEILRKHELWISDGLDGERADLWGANLRGANLQDANLRGADLQDANLQDANLRGADLQDANLRGANLQDANLRGANLWGANLRGANLQDANLRGANLPNNISAIVPLACPSEDAFIGWKKCLNMRADKFTSPTAIVKLLIPEHALRSSATSRKCRASEAKVLDIYDMYGKSISKVISSYDPHFEYKIGETVKPEEAFNTDRWNECASGIHFFITREEAEAYRI